MGSTFAGLHVRSTDLEAARRAVTQAMAQLGLVPAEGPADRCVALVPGGAWLAVLDEAADGGDAVAMELLGTALSRTLAAPTVGALVLDSDALRLSLYQEGKRRDRFDSAPEVMGGHRTKPARHVEAWRHLATSEPEALPQAFVRDALFAEAPLQPLARALGLDPERVGRGHRYQAEEGWPTGTVLLHYRDPSVQAEAPQGPPALAPSMPLQVQPVPEGGEVRVHMVLRNEGGPGSGLQLEVSGCEDLVQWQGVQLTMEMGPRGRPVLHELHGGRAQVDVALPVGLGGDPIELLRRAPHRAHELVLGGSFGLTLQGRAIGVGGAVVRLRILDRAGALLLETRAPVEVRSTEGRPLRAAATMAPQMLALLDDDSWLTAMVVCSLDRPAAVTRLVPIVEALAPYLPTSGPVIRTIYPGAGRGGLLAALRGGQPKMWSGKAAGLWKGKAWKTLVEAAAGDAAQVELSFGEEEEGPDRSNARIALGSGMIPMPDSATALTLGLLGAGPEVERAMVDAIDAAVRAGGIAQAFVSRRGGPASPELTSYEACCGIHGQCTLQRSWVRDWVRAVPVGTLWLGPGLQARIQRTELGPYEQVGDNIKLAVPERAPIEGALAHALPDGQDWQQGTTRLYRR